MKRTRRIYWLVNELSPAHRGRAMILAPHGFEIKFFTSLAEIQAEIRKRRAGIVFISDDSTEFNTDLHIRALGQMPELNGARLVLTVNNAFKENLRVAAALNFRDFIPLDLADDLWVQRVEYSCSGKAWAYTQPAGQVSMNNISAINLPCRLIWMSDSRIRLEAKINPPIGSKFKLTGRLADSLGMKHISLTVEKREKTHLHYRFSDAIIARWKVPFHAKEKFEALAKELNFQSAGPRYRAFVAAKSAPLRNELLEKLGRDDFAVNSALQLYSISSEPKYIKPDLVFIEDVLTINQHAARFSDMLEHLSSKVAVIIIGEQINREQLKKQHSKNRLLFIKAMPENFDAAVLDKVLPSISRGTPNTDVGASHLPSSDEVSFAELQLPARLKQIHPKVVHFCTPFDLGRFGIARLSSPILKKILGRDPWVKITDSHRIHKEDSAPFIHASESYLMDTRISEQKQIALSISELVQSHYAKFTDDLATSFDYSKRTPEFGSLKPLQFPAPSAVARDKQLASRLPGNTSQNITSNPAASNIAVKQAESALLATAQAEQQTAAATNAYKQQEKVISQHKEADSKQQVAYEEVDLSAEDIRPSDLLTPVHQTKLMEVKIDRNRDYQDFGDKALDVAQNVYDNLRSRSFKRTVILVAFTAFALSALLTIVYSLAQDYNRSGDVFTKSLYNYAPYLKKNGKKKDSDLPIPFQRSRPTKK